MTTTTAIHHATGLAVAVTTAAGRAVSCVLAEDTGGLPVVAPPFLDVQVNGCRGVNFTDPAVTPDGVRLVAAECRRHGVGQFLPTVITSDFETIRGAFAALAAAVGTDPELAARTPGFHLEGPYIAAEDGPRGAHPKEHARDPDWDEFRRWQDAAGGRIRMVTLAPERPGALPFIEKLAAAGVIVAVGHTAAAGEVIRAAALAGAKTSTHLGNGCHAVLPRHDNTVWEQMACDQLYASVIADGHHLPRAVLQSIVRAKQHRRVLLTADTGPLAGLPPGRYENWGQELEVLPDGKIVVPGTPYLAGSGRFLGECLRHVVGLGLGVRDAVEMATVRPRELMGLRVPPMHPGEEVVFVDRDGVVTPA